MPPTRLLARLAFLLAALVTFPAGAEPPAVPRVTEVRGGPGRPGGELESLISRDKDTRLFSVYGYARIVGYTPDLDLVPDIAERVDVEADRVFTIRLRPGHKWSDGRPFTAEDFRYYWRDVAFDPELSPFGPPLWLTAGGRPARFEVLDPLTVRFAWDVPNPFFLPSLAAATAEFIYRPAHYLKQFHKRHARPDDLARKVEEEGARDWVELHFLKDRLYEMDNPDLPTLQPWNVVTRPPATRFVAERNRHFHRVDRAGRQLPYADRMILNVIGSDLIPAKAGAGEVDLQARGLAFADYTFLREGTKRGGHVVDLWTTARGAEFALFPNLTCNDPVWRALFRDVRFRRALSLAVNRDEINQVLYFGLGILGNNTVLPSSRLFRPEHRYPHTAFDLDAANSLLDTIGLTERDSNGVRLLPDGRPMEIVVEGGGEDSQEADILELVADGFARIGVKIFPKSMTGDVLDNRVFAGDALMTIGYGIDNGVPTASMPPTEFTPVEQAKYQWAKWGQYHETSGKAGEPVDYPPARQLLDLYTAWKATGVSAEHERIWRDILKLNAEQVFTIGLIAGVRQPVVRARGLMGVPEEALFNWEPGGQFGIYNPDTFWHAGR